MLLLDADMGEAPGCTTHHGECLAMLERALAVVADLSPFRGPRVDDGTAFELGFAAALGLSILGYATPAPVARADCAATSGKKRPLS